MADTLRKRIKDLIGQYFQPDFNGYDWAGGDETIQQFLRSLNREVMSLPHPDEGFVSDDEWQALKDQVAALESDHHVVYESGHEAVCRCGTVVSIYGRITTIPTEFGRHVRESRNRRG